MALFKCQACGAPLEVIDGTEIAYCPYCGMKQTLPKDPVQVMGDGTSVESLLKRAFMFLEDGEFEKANEYCDRVLDIDPENARAYLGKLMADFRVSRKEDLARCDPFEIDGNSNYKKALRFGGIGLFYDIKGLVFLEAVRRNDTDTVKAILHEGVDANTKGKDGRTALMYAADKGCTEVAEFLIEHGADVNAKTNGGWTALMYAAGKGHTETAELLLKHSADVNAKAEQLYGDTALISAAHGGYTETVELLLKHGADVNARNDFGKTALMLTTPHGHTETAELLIEHGADVNAKDKSGRTALMMAEFYGHKETANAIRRISQPPAPAPKPEPTPTPATTQASGCMTLILQALTVAIIITILVIYL